MKISEVGLTDEVFTHLDDGHQTVYAVTALNRRCLEGGPGIDKLLVQVDEEHAKFCMESRGVEQDRIAELLKNVDYLKQRVIFVAMPDGSHLLVDGTHRYVTYYSLNLPNIPAFMVSWEIAKEFIIDGMEPREDLMQHSHLTLLRKVMGPS